MAKVSGSVAGAIFFCACHAGAAFAQPATGTGFRPTFGGTGQTVAGREHIDAAVTVVEGGDTNTNVATLSAVATTTPLQQDGFYTELDPTLSAAWHGERSDFSVRGASVLRAYGGDLQDVFVGSHAIQLNLNSHVGRRSALSLSEGASYAPAFLSAFSSNPPVVSDLASSLTLNNAVETERSYSSATALGLSHNMTERTSVSLDSDFRYTTYRGDVPGYVDTRFFNVGGRVSHGLSRNLQFHAGYRFGEGEQVFSQNTAEHSVDIGFAYARPLSRTRRSTISLTLGPTIVNGPVLGASLTAKGQQFQMTGTASLNHQVSRTWSLLGSYQRGLSYVQGLSRPVFTDTASAGTSGFLSRRADLSLTAVVLDWTAKRGYSVAVYDIHRGRPAPHGAQPIFCNLHRVFVLLL